MSEHDARGTGSRLYRIWTIPPDCGVENERGSSPRGETSTALGQGSEELVPGRPDLGRIDPAGDYTPENCEWIPMKEQQAHRRNNVRIELDGELLTLAEAARRTGINRQTLADRLRAGKAGADLFRPPRRPSDQREAAEPPDPEAFGL